MRRKTLAITKDSGRRGTIVLCFMFLYVAAAGPGGLEHRRDARPPAEAIGGTGFRPMFSKCSLRPRRLALL